MSALETGLPTWDLTHLYAATDDPKIEADLSEVRKKAETFKATYKGKLAYLQTDDFARSLHDLEEIDDLMGRLASYAQLLYAGDNTDGEIARFYQNTMEAITDISSVVLFYTLEINRLDDATVEKLLSGTSASKYRSWVLDVRAGRAFQLSDDMEELLHEKSMTGKRAWNRLFDETMAGLRFPFQGEELTNSDILNKMSSTKAEERKEAAQSFGKVLGDNIRLFSLITNTLAKDKAIEDKKRGFAKPISSRNLSNLVEDDVVDALIGSVKESYGDLAHRYYGLKAKWMGQDKLDYWDRNAPLPNDDDRQIPWEEARETVLEAYQRFDPDMAAIGTRFFEENWIDVPPRAGKDSGAFAHPTTPSAHPYILLNYHGKVRDVMTLAHELGHGVHQVLAARQGPLLANTPLTLAETASVFGEMLTFQSMLAKTDNEDARRIMLASKVEDMLNTVVRQIAFCDFETRLHEARLKGELTSAQIGAIWMAVQTESLGPVFRFEEDYAHYWAYIPHFIHTPFYVYAYAFGDCLVNSLYDVFESGHPGFQEKYSEMLKAGGSKRHKELLAPFGLDASDPSFWKRGLGVVSGFIDKLEETL